MLESGAASAPSLYRKCTYSKGNVEEGTACAALEGVQVFVTCVQGQMCVVPQEESFKSCSSEFFWFPYWMGALQRSQGWRSAGARSGNEVAQMSLARSGFALLAAHRLLSGVTIPSNMVQFPKFTSVSEIILIDSHDKNYSRFWTVRRILAFYWGNEQAHVHMSCVFRESSVFSKSKKSWLSEIQAVLEQISAFSKCSLVFCRL